MSIDTILNIMGHWNLSADELMLVWLSLSARDEEGHPEYFAKWYNNGGKARLKPLFEGLKSKGIIHKDYDPESFDPGDIAWNQLFLKSWWKYSLALGQEFFSTYPSFCWVNGKAMPLKDITKGKCTSLDEFFFFYASQLGHNIQEHKKVIELIKWGKENDYPFGNIAAFVSSHLWTTIEEMRNNPNINNLATNITKDE